MDKYFPNDIVSEILTRLPAKSVCRFKSVSKRWQSLISSPQFVKSYTFLNYPSWAVLDRVVRVEPGSKSPFLSTQFGGGVNSLTIGSDYSCPVEGQPFLVAGRYGLLLFYVEMEWDRDPNDPGRIHHECEDDILVICNPISRQFYTLPKPPEPIDEPNSVGLAPRVGPNGLVVGFIVAEYRPIIGSETAWMVIFSTERMRWECKRTKYMLGEREKRANGVFVFDGHFFWIDLSVGLIVCDDEIGRFTRENELKCRIIELPSGCVRPYDTTVLEMERKIGVEGGCIQYVEVLEGVLTLYRMKDYKKEVIWGMVHKVNLVDIWSNETYLANRLPPNVIPYPLFIHPFHADIAFFGVGNCFFAINVGSKKVVSCDFHSHITNGYLSLVPFVIPSWPDSFPPRLRS